MTWSDPSEYHEQAFEGGMTQLRSGRILATVRYQRLKWPEDPANMGELMRGGSPILNERMPFKHVFLMNSADGGETWTEFRQLTTSYGQNYGYPAGLSDGTVVNVITSGYNPIKSGLAMISYDEGKTWEDEAYYLYAPEETSANGAAGHNQSVVLDDGTILTIGGTTNTGWSWAACIGRSDLTAIRWKPVKD